MNSGRRLAILVFVLCLFTFCTDATVAQVQVQSLFPNPVGSDTNIEAVRLVNTGTESSSLDGYWLRDGNGTPKTLWLTGSLASGEAQLITGLSLNNDTDWIEFWLNETLLWVSLPYQDAPEGLWWVWNALTNEWAWSESFTATAAGIVTPTSSPAVGTSSSGFTLPTPVPVMLQGLDDEDAADQSSWDAVNGAASDTVAPVAGEAPNGGAVAIPDSWWRVPALEASVASVSAASEGLNGSSEHGVEGSQHDASLQTSDSPAEELARNALFPEFDWEAQEAGYREWQRSMWWSIGALWWGGALCLIQVAPWWWKRYLQSRVW